MSVQLIYIVSSYKKNVYIYIYSLYVGCGLFIVIFFFREFQLMTSTQNKTSISFWCKQELNLRSLIHPSETLPNELVGTHDLFIVIAYP